MKPSRLKRYRLRIHRRDEPVQVIKCVLPGAAILRAHLAFLGALLFQERLCADVIDVCDQRTVCSVAFVPHGMPDDRYCHVCGCSEADACEGGCRWVERELCSACSPIRFMGFCVKCQ